MVGHEMGQRLAKHGSRKSSPSTSSPPRSPNSPAAIDGQCRSVTSPGPLSTSSISSERKFGPSYSASDMSTDRVFPIRSVVGFNPAGRRESLSEGLAPSTDDGGLPYAHRRTPSPTRPHQVDQALVCMRRKRAMSGPFSSIQADAARQGTVAPLHLDISASDQESDASVPAAAPADGLRIRSVSLHSGQQSLNEMAHMTTRFTHVETEGGHSVITGRDGVLQRCEDEPIHTPGAVQGFGALLALREEQDGSFVVRYASENSEKLLGYTPRQLFQLKSFMDILTEEQQDNLLDHIDFIRDEDADVSTNGPEVLSLSIRLPKKRRRIKLWCAIHVNPAHPELVICEFEHDDDKEFPLRPSDELMPDTPYDTLHSNPTLEEIEESTEILSKPLRILRSARKRRGEQGAMQVFDIMSQVQEQLASAPNLDAFLKVLVGIVKELTGFHRVMIYQFDSSYNGKVVTELVDTCQTIDLYKGLHFPASDIPRQARELYTINKVRLLYDRDLQTARIVCRSQEDLDVPLDMTHSYLRAMSPIHIKYLANMAVRSSMSISINAFGELWGLIACHSYGSHGMRVSFPIRKMCRLVGDTASRNIERLSYASRLQARKLINTAPTDRNPSGYIIASSDDLLKLFDADFGLLSIKGETKILGAMDQSQEALAMLEYLRMRKLTSVLASHDVREDFPDLRYPPGFQVLAGLLYVPLSVGGHDFIVFFRKSQIREVKWAGNPYERTIREGTAGLLEPRSSFKMWNESIVGQCREWNEEQVETAAVLCLVYGKFIEVWRQKEAALQSSKLTRLLLANSAHEVRTPLNAIINYLEIALEGSLDQETQENLARSLSASKSLIYVINDLLDLTKTEEGQNLIKDEIFDLPLCIKEATEAFHVDAKRKGIEYHVVQHPGLPRVVHGDGRRVRQAISNVTANAIGHTQNGAVSVEAFVTDMRERQAIVDFVIADSGSGMSPQQLDALFRDLEQVTSEETERRISCDDESAQSSSQTLGLGLAVVARIIRNMDGQLRLKSEPGQGSRFVIQLPFHLPDDSPRSSASGESSLDGAPSTHSLSGVVAVAPEQLRASADGEMLLIDGSSAIAAEEVASLDGASTGSRRSISSRSSHQSNAERLINAIQTPLSLNEAQSGGYFGSRRNSRASLGHRSGQIQAPVSLSTALALSPSKPAQLPFKPPRPDSGSAEVRDSGTPVRPVKVPDTFKDASGQLQVGQCSRVVFDLPSSNNAAASPTRPPLRTLVAEDDPINLKVLRKRLERAGHEVHHAVNGEDCATLYRGHSSSFDAILMDMQMPIVDGLTSTKMIRRIEGSPAHGGYSALAATNGRIPIFAVSASLVEDDRQAYVDAGFDGWILKPIDFKRLDTLLSGIQHQETRNNCLYVQGQWERGGWFNPRDTKVRAASVEEIGSEVLQE